MKHFTKFLHEKRWYLFKFVSPRCSFLTLCFQFLLFSYPTPSLGVRHLSLVLPLARCHQLRTQHLYPTCIRVFLALEIAWRGSRAKPVLPSHPRAERFHCRPRRRVRHLSWIRRCVTIYTRDEIVRSRQERNREREPVCRYTVGTAGDV